MPRKSRYEELLPHEMEEIMGERPIAHLPWSGTAYTSPWETTP